MWQMRIKPFLDWLAEHLDNPGPLGLAAKDAARNPDVYSRTVLLRACDPQFHHTPLGRSYARARRSYKTYVARHVARLLGGQ